MRDDNPAYYVWTPGSNRYVDLPLDVNWGDDEARLFRCWSGKPNRCVTYVPMRDCNPELTDTLRDTDQVFIVSWAGGSEMVAAVEQFGRVNTVVKLLSA